MREPSSRSSVAIVTEHLPRSDRGEITGGIEARCFYVGRLLEPVMDVEYVADRTNGTEWSAPSLSSMPKRLWFLVRTFATLMRSDAEIFDASNQVVYPVVWLAGKLKRRRIVFWVPDLFGGSASQAHLGWAAHVLGVAEWCALHLPVDRYIAISTSTLEKMVAKGVPRHAIDLVPCGFDPTAAERIRSERVCGPPRPTLVVVSRLVPYKRVDVVIRALAILSSDIDDITLRIVGQGPDRRRLESLAQELGVADRVRFEGFVGSHDEVLGMVAEARCLVSASEIEGFGIVVVEAQSVGVPVVLSDIPAFKELVPDGHGGRLFSAGNAAALAAAVRPFLVDDERWTAASREAIEHSARYRWSAVAEATAATYERAVGRRLMSVTAVNA